MAVQKPLVVDNGTTQNLPAGDQLDLGGYALPATDGASGDVITTDGAGNATWSAPTGGPPSGAAGPTYLSGTYPDPAVVGLGQKVLWLVEGGKYATLQAAFNAASEGDTIMVGPKATGTWGDLTIAENKTMSIVGLNGPQGKTAKVGAITFSPTTGGLNINRNEYFFANVMITGSFASQAVLFSGTGAGRMRFVGCYVDNTSATGDGVVNSNTFNTGSVSSLYLDNCVVQVVTTTGVGLRHSGQYTWIKNRTQIEGGLHAIEQTAGSVDIVGASIAANGALSTVELSGTASLTMGYSTISNSSDAAGAIGVNVNSATAFFGAGDATISVGSSGAAAGTAVAGSGVFSYTNVSFAFVTSLTVTTRIPANNLIGNSTTDILVNTVKVGRGGGSVTSNFVLANASSLALNSGGNNCVAIGANSLNNATGAIRNVAVGSQALRANVTGSTNTAVGYFALDACTGSGNTALGNSAGSLVTTGSNVTCVGGGSASSSSTVSNEVSIGNNAVTTFRIGTATVTTPPAAGQAGFSVLNASTGSTVAVLAHSANAAAAAFVRFYSNGATGTGAAITQAAGGGFPILYSTGSDYRFKQDVEAVDPVEAVSRLLNLRPVRYHFTSQPEGPLVEGFIAHEVQEVVPQAVTHSKDAVDADGNPECQMFDQSHLIPLLTAACQGLHAQNQQLEARLAALEAAFAAKP